MMGTEVVPETSVSSCNQLTWLCAREDFIEFHSQYSTRTTGESKFHTHIQQAKLQFYMGYFNLLGSWIRTQNKDDTELNGFS
jgi:hypothetical protein